MNTTLGIGILIAYVCILLIIGALAAKVTLKTREDYFLASRGLGSVAVFMALFATNITAFTIIGHAGFAYQAGYGAYGYVIGWSIFITPFTYYLVGYRSWLLGKRYGYATQPQVFGAIFNSRLVKLLFLILLLYYTLPYLVVSIIGGSLAFTTISEGLVPYWLSAVLIIGISLIYTLPAGLRGTVWTDIFQGTVFLVLAIFLLFAVAQALGGFSAITERITQTNPAMLQRSLSPQIAPINWFSFAFINSIAVIVFPQMYTRILAARSSRNLKRVTLYYPLALAVIFGVSTLLGVWGSVAVPGLVGKDSDNIVPLLIQKFLSPTWTVLGLVAILAIVKSSIDSQLLSVAHLVTDDLLPRFKRISSQQAVFWGRIVLVIFAAAAFYIALVRPAAILSIAAFAFSGFSVILPVMIAGLYWPRANKYGAIAALIVPAIMLHLWYLEILPKWTTFGFMPVFPTFVLAILILVVVSYLTPAPPSEQREKTFGLFDQVFNAK
ncbi:MAG: sodium:solute symporter family protein [Clostridia bacterium]|nr:sodium:solute symporter family protein [Clostridia bacterium]